MRANSPDPRFPHLRNAWAVITQRWFAPLAVLVLVFDLLFAIAVVQTGEGSGRVVGPIVLSLCAAGIGVGLWLRWRAVGDITERMAASAAVPRPVSRWTIGGLIAVPAFMGPSRVLLAGTIGIFAMIEACEMQHAMNDEVSRMMQDRLSSFLRFPFHRLVCQADISEKHLFSRVSGD